MKYTNVTYALKNGNMTTRQIERGLLGDKLKSSAKTKLKDAKYTPDEIEFYLGNLVETNNIDSLPEDIAKQYKLEDCLVYIPLTEEILDSLNSEIDEKIKDINERTEQLNILKCSGVSAEKYEELFWDSEESLKKNEYFFYNLCGYTREQHRPWDRYLKKQEALEKQKTNMLYTEADAEAESQIEEDLSWLDDLLNL